MALIGVKSKSVKDDHLCYHSAQKQGSSDFVDMIEDLEDYVSLISFQINSISSFSIFLYKYSIRQRRTHHDLRLKTHTIPDCVVLLL